MRKGLLSWDENEVPRAVLEARVARAQAGMREAGLDALLIYTNFPRPAGVSFLTHFVPYWSQGALLVPPAGMPSLYVNLSKRVAGWMQETAHVDAVVSTPRLGQTLGTALSRIRSDYSRLGVVELPKFPASVLTPLAGEHGNVEFIDATGVFSAFRHPADDTEIALSRRAAAIASDAIAAAVADKPTSTSVLAAGVEYAGRKGGAEEIVIDVCADLASDALLRRFEGDDPLGARYAVRASVAYKGHWVRYGRTVDRATGRIEEQEAALDAAIARMANQHSPAGGEIIEAAVGCSPLSVIRTAPSGAVVSVTITGQTEPGEHFAISEPILTPIGNDAPAGKLLS